MGGNRYIRREVTELQLLGHGMIKVIAVIAVLSTGFLLIKMDVLYWTSDVNPVFIRPQVPEPVVRRLSLQLHSMHTMSGSVKKKNLLLFLFLILYCHSIYRWCSELFGYAMVRKSCTSAEESPTLSMLDLLPSAVPCSW